MYGALQNKLGNSSRVLYVHTTKAFFTYVWTLSAAEAEQSILQMIHINSFTTQAQIFTPVLSNHAAKYSNGRLGEEQNDKRSKDPPHTQYSVPTLKIIPTHRSKKLACSLHI
jgi:hypothetical protein